MFQCLSGLLMAAFHKIRTEERKKPNIIPWPAGFAAGKNQTCMRQERTIWSRKSTLFGRVQVHPRTPSQTFRGTPSFDQKSSHLGNGSIAQEVHQMAKGGRNATTDLGCVISTTTFLQHPTLPIFWRMSQLDCTHYKWCHYCGPSHKSNGSRAVTVLDRDRSNSPERRTRTEVFFIFRTLVLKFGKNPENLALFTLKTYLNLHLSVIW